MTEPRAAIAVLGVLVEHWPEQVPVEKVVVDDSHPGWVVVTVWTSTPGRLIGQGGATASEVRDRLRAAVPNKALQFEIRPGDAPGAPASSPAEGKAVETVPQGRDAVPDLVGMTVRDAHAKARSAGFRLALDDADGSPITVDMVQGQFGSWAVIGQHPSRGTLAPLHSQITLAAEPRGEGGGSGDREPRVPRPPGGLARLEHALATEDGE